MKSKYRPEIDGLRTLAVGGVILFHLDPNWLPGGYLGVDVFFVISGFLISSLILRDLQEDAFSFRNFWTRRAKRILPAMLAMTAVTLAAVWFFGFRGDIPVTGGHAVAALLSFANIYSWQQTGDYWGADSESAPLLHTWSLSVEEQFYLIVPLMLFLLYRYARVLLPYVVIMLVAASLALFIYGANMRPNGTFYLLPTRAWELGVGVALACTRPMPSGHEHLKKGVALLGMTLILASYLLLPKMQSGAPVAVFGTAMILWGGQHGLLFRVLSTAPFVYIGKLSYSLYLWHWPVIVLGRELPERPISVWAILALTAILSLACYYIVERPMRFAKTSLPYILGATAAAIAISGAVYHTSGVYDTSDLPLVTYHRYEYGLRPNQDGVAPDDGPFASMNLPSRTAPIDSYRTGGIVVGPADSPPRVVLTGNSHGVMWSNAMYEACEELGVSARLWSMDGIDPAFANPPVPSNPGFYISQEAKLEFDIARHEKIAQWRPAVVFLSARWENYSSKALLLETLDYLSDHSGQVILIGQPPVLDIGQRYAVQVLAWRGVTNQGDPDVYMDVVSESWEAGNQLIYELAAAYDNVSVLDTYDLFTDSSGDRALVMTGGEILYFDDDHVAEAGAQRVKPRFIESISRFVDLEKPAE
jgi:peptidoglycan/LPS O-acetylase OafA/YrhL